MNAVLWLTLTSCTYPPGPVQETQPPIVDHHLHVLSPQLISDWKAAGARFSRDDESYSNPQKFCDANNITKGFLVSMAHLYTSGEFGTRPNSEDERKRVAKENDFVSDCVRTAPDRFVGFFSVNPLRDWAADEMVRCRRKTGLRGLKLHLPACGMHLGNKQHVAVLRKTFAWCAKNDVPVLAHISGFRRPFGAVEARIFWQELVRPNLKLHLYLAHIGASGGYNDRSEALFAAYQKLVSDSPDLRKTRVFFDLSGAILAEAVDGAEPTSKERCKQLAEQIRSIGIERFLFASDYPVFSPTRYITALTERLPLTKEELEKLLQAQSPLFKQKSTAWNRHTIDAASRGADGVRLADINDDGLPDCVTGWEEGGTIRVCLHPGHEKAKFPWPAVEVGRVKSPEDAVFADVDGDGNTDVISSCEGKQRCIFLHLAPDKNELLRADAWQTVPIEASTGRQWMYALPSRVDADRRVDFFAGSKGPNACLAWFTASENPRDGHEWDMHKIADAGWIISMVVSDMNRDGLDDLIVSDRRGKTRGVHWFEHPGPGKANGPWRRHTLGGTRV